MKTAPRPFDKKARVVIADRSSAAAEQPVDNEAAAADPVPEELRDYFHRVEKMLDENAFENEQDRDLFVSNVYNELENNEILLARDQVCSRILEKLLKASRPFHLRVFMDRLTGTYVEMAQDRCASHVLQTLLTLMPPFVEEELGANASSSELKELHDDDAGVLLTLKDLVLSLCSELQEQSDIATLALDTYASHVLRVLFTVLVGVAKQEDAVVRSKSSRGFQAALMPEPDYNAVLQVAEAAAAEAQGDGDGDSGGSGEAEAGAESAPKTPKASSMGASLALSLAIKAKTRKDVYSVPPAFLQKLSDISNGILDYCSRQEDAYDSLLSLATSPVASPVLQALLLALQKPLTLQCELLCRRLVLLPTSSLAAVSSFSDAKSKTAKLSDAEKAALVHTSLVVHKVGSHLMEKIFQVSTPELFLDLFSLVFRGRLLELSLDRSANFVVQSLLQHVHHEAQLKLIFDELNTHLEEILAEGHIGVVVRLAQACEKKGTLVVQKPFLRSLFSTFHAPKQKQQKVIAQLLLTVVTYEKFLGIEDGEGTEKAAGSGSDSDEEDEQEHESKSATTAAKKSGKPGKSETSGKSRKSGESETPDKPAKAKQPTKQPVPELSGWDISYHGAQLVQSLLNYPASENRSVVESLVSLSVGDILYLCRHDTGSRVIESFLSGSALYKKKLEVLRKLRSHYCVLALDKWGSHIVDKCWGAGDISAKEWITEELLTQETKLRASFYGRFVLRNCQVDRFKRKRDSWKQALESNDRKVKMFADILEDDGAVTPKADASSEKGRAAKKSAKSDQAQDARADASGDVAAKSRVDALKTSAKYNPFMASLGFGGRKDEPTGAKAKASKREAKASQGGAAREDANDEQLTASIPQFSDHMADALPKNEIDDLFASDSKRAKGKRSHDMAVSTDDAMLGVTPITGETPIKTSKELKQANKKARMDLDDVFTAIVKSKGNKPGKSKGKDKDASKEGGAAKGKSKPQFIGI